MYVAHPSNMTCSGVLYSSHVSSSCCVWSPTHKGPAFCVPAADTEEDFVLIDELGCPNGYFDLLASTLGKLSSPSTVNKVILGRVGSKDRVHYRSV
jgi:hypothetical protein